MSANHRRSLVHDVWQWGNQEYNNERCVRRLRGRMVIGYLAVDMFSFLRLVVTCSRQACLTTSVSLFLSLSSSCSPCLTTLVFLLSCLLQVMPCSCPTWLASTYNLNLKPLRIRRTYRNHLRAHRHSAHRRIRPRTRIRRRGFLQTGPALAITKASRLIQTKPIDCGDESPSDTWWGA